MCITTVANGSNVLQWNMGIPLGRLVEWLRNHRFLKLRHINEPALSFTEGSSPIPLKLYSDVYERVTSGVKALNDRSYRLIHKDIRLVERKKGRCPSRTAVDTEMSDCAKRWNRAIPLFDAVSEGNPLQPEGLALLGRTILPHGAAEPVPHAVTGLKLKRCDRAQFLQIASLVPYNDSTQSRSVLFIATL